MHKPSMKDPAQLLRILFYIQTDMEYPNAFRPADNPGYQTQYNP